MPEVLEKIDKIVIKAGHTLIGKKVDEGLRGRCDSFVVETDVHYPTDINLLFDAIRKLIQVVAQLCSTVGLKGWRQSVHNIKKIKKLFRKAQKVKKSTSQDETKKAKQQKLIKKAPQAYIDIVTSFIEKVKETLNTIKDRKLCGIEKIEGFISHAERQIDQIQRRVISDEVIPHEEKVFSIFEEHTEWISKGQAGIPVALVCKELKSCFYCKKLSSF